MPLNSKDDTVKLLRETFKYLQTDGKIHLAEDLIQAGKHNNLHQPSQSIVTGLLTATMVAGSKTTDVTLQPELVLKTRWKILLVGWTSR